MKALVRTDIPAEVIKWSQQAVQEIEALKKEIEALKARITALEEA